FFLQVVELLLGVVQGFLFVGYLLLVVGILLVPLRGVAHAVASVGIHRCCTHLVFTLQHIEFASQQIDLFFLRGELALPLLPGGLLLRHFFIGRFCWGRRLSFGVCCGGRVLAISRRRRGAFYRLDRSYDRELVFARKVVVVEHLRLGLRSAVLA